MRLVLVVGGIGVLSLACASPCGEGTEKVDGKCVADDIGVQPDDSGGGGSGEVRIQATDADPTLSSVVWSVAADGGVDAAELWIVSTGDPGYEGGCDFSDFSGTGGLICGTWGEYHTSFSSAGANEYGGETMEIALDIVDDYREQSYNHSTLFDVSNAEIADQLTVMFVIQTADGEDCVTYGDDPDFFASECSTVW